MAGNFFDFAIYVSFENEVVEAYVHRSSLTVMLLCCQGFVFVRLDLTRVSLSSRLRVIRKQALIKKTASVYTAMIVFNCLNAAAEIFS